MDAPRLTVFRHTTPEGVNVVMLHGEIDFNTSADFREAVVGGDARVLRTVIDFGHVTFMDSSGINVLVGAHRVAGACGGWIRLANLPAPVMEPLHIVGLDEVLALYPTLQLALHT